MSLIHHRIYWVRSAGICLVALALRRSDGRRREWDNAEWRLGSESSRRRGGGGIDHKVSDTWAAAHLVWGLNPLPGATCGFHWSYMLQGRPPPVRTEPEAAPPPCIWSPAGRHSSSLHLTHFQALMVIFPPFALRSSGWLGWLHVAVMSSTSNML